MIRIFNTLSGKKESLRRNSPEPIRLFVCGPTVYDFAHLGHARTCVFFDFFAKYLRRIGYRLHYLQNITNVDDKIIQRAREIGVSPRILASRYTNAYFDDMRHIGVTAVNTYAPATDFIPQIIEQVSRLIRKGVAYRINEDGYYFDISKFPDYGKLSHRITLQAEDAVSRIDESIKKRNRGDFCLWKFSSPVGRGDEPSWRAPFGDGRPGWHIEDTAISEHYFGAQYDIHGGGLDLKFPHHEAEIAQQEAVSGRVPFVKIWMHTGILTVGGEKMSKSKGNFVTIRDFLRDNTPATLRLLFLRQHYRAPMDYNKSLAAETEKNVASIAEFLGKLSFIAKKRAEGKRALRGGVAQYVKRFAAALADDANTPIASSAIFDAINAANEDMWNLQRRAALGLKEFVENGVAAFGIGFTAPKIPLIIKTQAAAREKFRTNKQFIQSDRLRKKIEALGYKVEDTPIGPFVWPKSKKANSGYLLKT